MIARHVPLAETLHNESACPRHEGLYLVQPEGLAQSQRNYYADFWYSVSMAYATFQRFVPVPLGWVEHGSMATCVASFSPVTLQRPFLTVSAPPRHLLRNSIVAMIDVLRITGPTSITLVTNRTLAQDSPFLLNTIFCMKAFRKLRQRSKDNGNFLGCFHCLTWQGIPSAKDHAHVPKS